VSIYLLTCSVLIKVILCLIWWLKVI
jgi:hypothetical protein